jgi:capsular polysaccharide export protein
VEQINRSADRHVGCGEHAQLCFADELMTETLNKAAAGDAPRRLSYVTGGFAWNTRLRRILHLAGYDLRASLPQADGWIAAWGHTRYARRAEWVATQRNAQVLRIEDAWLRGLHPGPKSPPIGLLIDPVVHYDARTSNGLEHALNARAPLSPTERTRATDCIAWMQGEHLTKYSANLPDLPPPMDEYVLIIDQVRGDASVRLSGAERSTFLDMLSQARRDYPNVPLLIKAHPAANGYLSASDLAPGDILETRALSPWNLLSHAHAVFTVSSQMGFEAILAGHHPHIFGSPFYAGWGLSQDRTPTPRRARKLDAQTLFHVAMLETPLWYDPHFDRLCEFEDVLASQAAQARAWREDHAGYDAFGMRLWKRPHIRTFFGEHGRLRFAPRRPSAPALVWGRTPTQAAHRVEDGLLRSRGLGADLVPPLSLIRDSDGLYYDPRHTSRMEQACIAARNLAPYQTRRAARLRAQIIAAHVSKYNLHSAPLPPLPEGQRILVPGQVADDASVELGATGPVKTNLDLLRTVRAARPNAVILYRPHPDVQAGLRPGDLPEGAQNLFDIDATTGDVLAWINAADEVWTLTSQTGFEALLRDKPVTCLGAPFYGGWGLTHDLAPMPTRRKGPALTLDALTYACLIDAPRYYDPLARMACSAEVAAARLADGSDLPRAPGLRALAKLQGALSSYAWLWRG